MPADENKNSTHKKGRGRGPGRPRKGYLPPLLKGDQGQDKRRWRLLQVESALGCNLRCIMCPWRDYSPKAGRGIMAQETWAALRPRLVQALSIDFSGGGEPLLQPRLEDWIRDAKEAGCETGFLTNGLLLTRDRAHGMILAGLDWMGISMDGATKEVYEEIRRGSSFEKVCENLGRLAQLRVDKVPKTMINFVLMERNAHQMEEIVTLAARLGVDQVNFKQCDVIRGERAKGHGLFDRVETRRIRRLKKALSAARRLAKKLHVQTWAFSFTPEEQPVCEQDPRDSLFIRYDGLVAPCISLAYGGPTTFLGEDVFMPAVHYGHLPEDDLVALWQSEACQQFRACFQNRVMAHEETLLEGLVGGSWNRQRTLERAREAMPPAPHGCRVCHYLFDI